ncbi:hypothetical protein [Streptomyces bambusae]|uniref:Lipoprotein n=1 Tax=Streptomyces bambusae TaxID=1550616 RepID=A0ABS6Z0G0_9ACTN|nr:hypothetical protein [Streptomyces bambusae]MBW5481192.1 hypothetical protein [Streptomyces bambusae]
MNMPRLPLFCAVLLVGTTLSGCSLLSLAESCEGTEAAVTELAQLPILDVRPPRATPVDGGEALGAHCVDDTAGAWLQAGRLYAYEGSRTEVLEYYGRQAPAAGWRPVDDLDLGPDGRRAVFCFESATQPSVTLGFPSPRQLREFYGVDPGPGADGTGPRTWYILSAEATPDGSRMSCTGS